MDSGIIVATHKKYWMPEDGIYIPLQVGCDISKTPEGRPLNLGYRKDNTGDEISRKNRNYCELTGLYWAWKNLKSDYAGLVHYRRHFSVKRKGTKQERVLNARELKSLFKKADILLPKKRRYFIETNYSQYAHAHHAVDLDTTKEIISEKYPDYIPAFEKVMKRTSGHRFNMFIMKRQYFDEYCEWLFDILFELEKRLDISQYSENDSRVFGFVSERLLDVWIETRGYDYLELPYIFMEKQNWLVKGSRFLLRKFR